MDLKEMFKKLKSSEISAHSELGSRDESKQTRSYGTRIQKLKPGVGVNARVLPMKDMVIPFNPFTGQEDEIYSKSTPFRPILLVSQVISGLKNAMSEDAEMKDFWEKHLGITFTPGEPTMEEYSAFKAAGYILPRVMSYSTVALNFGEIYGFSQFRTKYTVDPTQLNAEGSYDYGPGAPIWHQGAIFFNAMLKPEADMVVKKLTSEGASKDQITTARANVYAKSPVGFVGPTNIIPFFFFSHTEIPKTFDVKNLSDVEQALRWYGFHNKWVTALKEAMDNPMFDTDMDFYDFTLKTAAPGTLKSNGAVITDQDSLEIFGTLTISNTDLRMAIHGGKTYADGKTVDNDEAYASFFDAARAYWEHSQEQSTMEGGETFEKIMAQSNRFRPIESVMDSFLPACNDVFTTKFANTPYYTPEIKKANAPFLTAMNSDNAIAMADLDDDELEEASQEQGKSVADLIKAAAPTDDSTILETLEFAEN